VRLGALIGFELARRGRPQDARRSVGAAMVRRAARRRVAYLVTLGDSSPSQSIWTASVDGDYVVTPRMIEGHDDVDFVGG
jgi:hypothetical protein